MPAATECLAQLGACGSKNIVRLLANTRWRYWFTVSAAVTLLESRRLQAAREKSPCTKSWNCTIFRKQNDHSRRRDNDPFAFLSRYVLVECPVKRNTSNRVLHSRIARQRNVRESQLPSYGNRPNTKHSASLPYPARLYTTGATFTS